VDCVQSKTTGFTAKFWSFRGIRNEIF